MRCPICRSEVRSPTRRPFCSERCQQIDLAKWLGGDYRFEGPPMENDRPQLQEEMLAERGAGADEESSWN